MLLHSPRLLLLPRLSVPPLLPLRRRQTLADGPGHPRWLLPARASIAVEPPPKSPEPTAADLPPPSAESDPVVVEQPPQTEEEAAFSSGSEGPIELQPSFSLFAVDDNPTPLQVATSVLLTGAISIFLFRSVRRRARRAKELRLRSGGLKKANDTREEALDRLRAIGVAPIGPEDSPTPLQAMLGGIAAGVIAVILYKFTTTIEAALNRQAITDNFSVRQITITIRTIINGLCYLATSVFAINSAGLFFYSIQLTLGSVMGNTSKESSTKDVKQVNATNDSNIIANNVESTNGDDLQQISDTTKNSSKE